MRKTNKLNDKEKIYVIDTSVLLENPRFLMNLEGEVIIPIQIIRELDNNKTRYDSAGQNAREAVRLLENLRKDGSLKEGVKFNTINLRVSQDNCKATLPDDIIVEVAQKEKLKNKNKEVIVCSNDLIVRIKASAAGLESYSIVRPSLIDIFSGVEEIEATSALINRLFTDGKIEATREDQKKFYPNQFVVMKCGQQSAITRFRNSKFVLSSKKRMFGIDPKSKEQEFASELLMDENVELVSLIGRAGTGKTFLSIAAGLEQTLESKIYDKIIVIRPVVSLGKELGFLPGTIEEKLSPWTQPILDNLSVLFNHKKNLVEQIMSDGTIEIEALSYIRGRSIPKSFIIIDEAQNCNLKELKAIITRLAEGSKIVLCGDIDQIDSRSMDLFNNGLSQVIDKFKDQNISGHVMLKKGLRSTLASIASDIL